MTAGHGHSGAVQAAAVTAAAAALALTAAYLAAAARLRRRGDAWPWTRDASFAAGGAALAWAAVGALPGGPFTAHVARHLLAGMAAPLLLVLARPLTLALRALPPGRARRCLLGVARSRAAGVLVLPPVAALLDAGGLWVLYRTGLFAASRERAPTHVLVHVHVVAAGLLFAFAVCQADPVRRRWGPAVRGAALLAAGAAHAVLAKSLYVSPPPGTAVAAEDLRTGARLMYYGGDAVEAALAAALAARWYAAAGRARVRRCRRWRAAPGR
ncbi:hypothetical protein GCM10027168_39500 [Streptomyces capparidis]